MTLADVHFSSATDLRSTPQEFFDSCDKIFRFASRRILAVPADSKRTIWPVSCAVTMSPLSVRKQALSRQPIRRAM
jgi:hypothetical protein